MSWVLQSEKVGSRGSEGVRRHETAGHGGSAAGETSSGGSKGD